MSEIEKLMQNAEIKPEWQDCCKLADKYWDNENLAGEYVCFDHYMKAVCPHNQECTDECKHAYNGTIYPEFTAEKQLKVLKILAYDDERYVSFGFDYGIWKINCHTEGYDAIRARCESFEEAVALLVNEQWLYLTESEKAEIRRILE